MKSNDETTRRLAWHTAITISIFVMAAAGAVFALYKLLPRFFSDPIARRLVISFGVVLIVAFVLIALVARLRRN